MLRDAIAVATSQEVVTPFVIATFSTLADTDKDIVARAVLTYFTRPFGSERRLGTRPWTVTR
ncbi:hypothetical protein [Dactylosporangium sp. CA-233914]|uniref:hypothetical protein n=1 Tax=Dactylosporangium sp. CA-233914 TaxID=3239934 RepID=UPI003D9306DA